MAKAQPLGRDSLVLQPHRVERVMALAPVFTYYRSAGHVTADEQPVACAAPKLRRPEGTIHSSPPCPCAGTRRVGRRAQSSSRRRRQQRSSQHRCDETNDRIAGKSGIPPAAYFRRTQLPSGRRGTVCPHRLGLGCPSCADQQHVHLQSPQRWLPTCRSASAWQPQFP